MPANLTRFVILKSGLVHRPQQRTSRRQRRQAPAGPGDYVTNDPDRCPRLGRLPEGNRVLFVLMTPRPLTSRRIRLEMRLRSEIAVEVPPLFTREVWTLTHPPLVDSTSHGA